MSATKAAEVSFVTSAVDATGSTVYTFSSQSLGAAATNRKVVVVVVGFDVVAQTVSSATIGGVAASIIIQQAGASSEQRTAIIQANVPTGTTGDVVITWTGAMDRCGIGIFRVVGAVSSANDSKGNAAGSGSNSTVDLNIPANGVAVCGGMLGGNIRVTMAGLTEKYDENMGTQGQFGGSDAFTALDSAHTITITPASAAINTLVAASWGPA